MRESNSLWINNSPEKSTLLKGAALLGGSFDPVHKGHTEIIDKLLERFDKVIVVPAKVSPFKTDSKTAESEDRLAMLRLALADKKEVEISDFELNSEGVSYSYLTANHFKNELNSTVFQSKVDKSQTNNNPKTNENQLFFVVGSEMLETLHKWKNIDQLKEIVSFYVVPREGYPLNKQLVQDKLNGGVKLQVADFEIVDYSSSMIKVDIAFKRAEKSLNEAVFDYINQKQMYQDYVYITSRYQEFGLKSARVEHTYRAVKAGIQLAKIHDVDISKTITALLLHDIAKYTSRDVLIEKYYVPNFHLSDDMPVPCMHAPIGAKIAKACFGIEDEDILNAIETHTTCAPKMSDLQKIVAIADFIEEGRRFHGIDKIRQLAKVDLDRCMEAMLKSMITHLNGKHMYKATRDAYKYYKKLQAKEKK